MKIEDLKLFVKVVELGNFTAAANALDLPRANVSRRINDLESSLNTSLFHRTTRSLSLTNQGEIYYHELLKALEMLDSAGQALNQDEGSVKGKVKLGILPITNDFLQPILFDFLDQYPEIELDVRVIQNGFIDMHQQGLDIAFHGGELIDSDLIARKILQLDRSLVASKSYLDKHGKPDHVEQLVDHQTLCFRWPNGEVDEYWSFSDQTIRVHSKLVVNSIVFLKDAAITGRGICFLPNILVRDQLENGQLVSILEQAEAKTEHGYLLYPQPKSLNHASRVFIDHLLQELPKLG